LLLLLNRPLFGGDIGLNGFKLVAIVGVSRCGAQQYASAKRWRKGRIELPLRSM
jgi:hypothetical protein